MRYMKLKENTDDPKIKEISFVGENMEQLKFPYMADRNANWYNRFGKNII